MLSILRLRFCCYKFVLTIVSGGFMFLCPRYFNGEEGNIASPLSISVVLTNKGKFDKGTNPAVIMRVTALDLRTGFRSRSSN